MKRAGAAMMMVMVMVIPSCEERTTCANADYSVCGTPLPRAMNIAGDPWPTFDQALAETMACPYGRGPGDAWVMRGECADGKQFVGYAGGFTGETRFFRNGVLVGRSHYTDVGGDPCQCAFSGFEGTLDSVRCERPTFEPLCETEQPRPGFDPGFTPAAVCACDASDVGY